MLGEGDTCACNPTIQCWSCLSTAEAVEESQVWFLSRDNYIKMVNENSTLMHALNDLFAKRLQCFSDIIEEVAMKDTKKRLIKFLLDMLKDQKNQSSGSDVLFIKATHEEISHRLGAARETIARHISELKSKKLIEVKPYQIVILDKEALEKLLR
jgi:CRP-like cAMP-binding protein